MSYIAVGPAPAPLGFFVTPAPPTCADNQVWDVESASCVSICLPTHTAKFHEGKGEWFCELNCPAGQVVTTNQFGVQECVPVAAPPPAFTPPPPGVGPAVPPPQPLPLPEPPQAGLSRGAFALIAAGIGLTAWLLWPTDEEEFVRNPHDCRVPVLSKTQSRRRIAYLRRIGCEVTKVNTEFGTVVLRSCPD